MRERMASVVNPNILFICSDQQRTDTMAAYGNDWIQTPNLNALADRSAVFENAYVTQAVCSPARGTMLTGLYPHSAGVVRNSQPGRPSSNLPEDVMTIAEMAPDEYLTAKFGKWHLGQDLVPQHGFDEWVSTEDAHDDGFPNFEKREHRYLKSDYYRYLVKHGYEPAANYDGHLSHTQHQRGFLPEEHTMAAFLARQTSDFIRRNTDRPWLMYMMNFEPHPPYNGPLNELYDPDSIPDGPLLMTSPAQNTPLFTRARSRFHSAEASQANSKDPRQYWRELRAKYFGNMTVLDNAIGQVLAALEDSGQADRTVVIFTSDHGDSLGDRGMLGKRSFYEEVSKVPMLISVPWLTGEGRRIAGSFGHVDLVPTILDLMGVEPPEHLQGRSRVDVLSGNAVLDGDVFMQWHGGRATISLGDDAVERMSTVEWRSVVTQDRWKLNLSNGDQCELYNLNEDPLELSNLFDETEHRDRVRDMAARIRQWQAETGDDMVLPAV